jgi:Ca2+-binding EF-hand superfamily protein
MINFIVKWFLRVVNKRICSVDEFREVLKKMDQTARYDTDGYISVGDMIKLLVKSFNFVRLNKNG